MRNGITCSRAHNLESSEWEGNLTRAATWEGNLTRLATWEGNLTRLATYEGNPARLATWDGNLTRLATWKGNLTRLATWEDNLTRLATYEGNLTRLATLEGNLSGAMDRVMVVETFVQTHSTGVVNKTVSVSYVSGVVGEPFLLPGTSIITDQFMANMCKLLVYFVHI